MHDGANYLHLQIAQPKREVFSRQTDIKRQENQCLVYFTLQNLIVIEVPLITGIKYLPLHG